MSALLNVVTRFCWFIASGNAPRKAFWLARHQAPVRLGFRSISWAALRAALDSGGTWEDLELAEGTIRSRTLGLDTGCFPPLCGPAFGQLREAARRSWTFQPEGQVVLARHQGLNLRIETEEEANMLHEIFVQDCYGLALPGRWRVLDIGGNAGFAALSFASRPEVAEVLSFEPFGPTAAAYQRNVDLNPGLAPKIRLRQLALSDHDGEATVQYLPELRGSMSTSGLGSWRPAAGTPSVPVTLQLRRASTELRQWLEASAVPVFAKVDCEGAEYQILPELAAAGLLERLQVLILEWHGDGREQLERLLTGAGYSVRATPLSTDGKSLGLLLAQRLP